MSDVTGLMFFVIGTHRSVGRLMSPDVSRCTYCDILEYAVFNAQPSPKEYFNATLGSGLKYAFPFTKNKLRRAPGLKEKWSPRVMSSSIYRESSEP